MNHHVLFCSQKHITFRESWHFLSLSVVRKNKSTKSMFSGSLEVLSSPRKTPQKDQKQTWVCSSFNMNDSIRSFREEWWCSPQWGFFFLPGCSEYLSRVCTDGVNGAFVTSDLSYGGEVVYVPHLQHATPTGAQQHRATWDVRQSTHPVLMGVGDLLWSRGQ